MTSAGSGLETLDRFQTELERLRQLAFTLGLGTYADDPASLIASLNTASADFSEAAENLNKNGQAMAFARIMGQVPKLRTAIEQVMTTGDAALLEGVTARFSAVARAIEKAKLENALSDPLSTSLQAYEVTFASWVDADAAFGQQMDAILQTSQSLDSDLLAMREELSSGATIEASRLEQVRASTNQKLLAIMAGVGVLIVSYGVLLLFSVVRPLNRVRSAVHELSSGNLEVDLDALPRNHELGAISNALTVFKVNATERAEIENLRTLERQKADEAKRLEMNRLADLFEENVNSLAHEITHSANHMRDLASQSAEGSVATKDKVRVALDAAETSGHLVNAVASAAEELNASFKTVNEQIVQTRDASKAAVSDAIVASNKIADLSVSVEEINSVLVLIQDVAEQTNLLALNATIEAARAGEAGKGFAVVAAEVKGLANQTSSATTEISNKISNISSSTTDAVQVIDQIQAQIQTVEEYANSVTASIEEQWKATNEIAENAETASANVTSISSDLGEVGSVAETGISASSGVLSSANTLVEHSGRLETQMANFVGQVRAG
ncbi:methyl-accepting chemotaxis protein [Roseibium sp. SCP14]|uniref:methyl-accepting chemotaxis protein n=1 Tax=Roseibium sp. SCP14 TaxID=3141375 RepID=UPI0033352463